MTSTSSTTSRLRGLRRSWRLGLAGLAVAAAATVGLAAPADASMVTAQGATVGASATSTTYYHQLTVRPYASVLPGWTSQWVRYYVLTREQETGKYRQFGPYGAYYIQPSTGGSVCVAIWGCGTYDYSKVPVNLPSATFAGTAGYHYDVWVSIGHWTGSSYVQSPWTIIDRCITGTFVGQACKT